MPDVNKFATIEIRGKIDESLTNALADVRKDLEQIRDLAKSIRVGAEATQAPPAARFPSLGSPATGALRMIPTPPEVRRVLPPRPPSVPPPAQPLPPRSNSRMPTPSWWEGLAASLLPAEGVVRQLLRPGGRHAARHAEPIPRAASGRGTPADAVAQAVQDEKKMRTAVERGTKAGLGSALTGVFDLFRFGRSAAPPKGVAPIPAPGAPTVTRGVMLEDRQALFDRLRAAGATAREAATTAGLPVPKSASSSMSDLAAAALGLESGGLLSRGIKSATGPLGSLLGVGALAGGVAYGLQFAPPAAALGQQLGASPNGMYQGLLTNNVVRSGLVTPDQLMSASTELLASGGRMAGSGQQAMLAMFKDTSAAAKFARAVGITPSTSAGVVGALVAAGVISPGGVSAAAPGLYGAAQASGLPGGTFAQGLQQFVSTVSPYAVPTAAASLLANTASFGQQFGIPALSGNRAAGTLGAISGSIASGSMLQGLPGPVLAQVLGALSPNGKVPTTVGGIYRDYQQGLTSPGQEARFFGVLRGLYQQRNYGVLNELLQPLGGYGSAQSTALERNVLGLPQSQFNKAMSALQSNPAASPSALKSAVAAYQASYGGSATGISGALQVAGGETFAGLSKPLSDLSSAVRGLTSPAKAIAAELGAGIALNLSSSALKALLGKGGGGSGGVGGGVAGGLTGWLAGSAASRALGSAAKAAKGVATSEAGSTALTAAGELGLWGLALGAGDLLGAGTKRLMKAFRDLPKQVPAAPGTPYTLDLWPGLNLGSIPAPGNAGTPTSGTSSATAGGTATIQATAPQSGEPLVVRIAVESGQAIDWLATLGDRLSGMGSGPGYLHSGARGSS